MRQAEKILLFVLLVISGLQTYAFAGKNSLFLLAVSALASYYLFWIFWMYGFRNFKQKFLLIASGVAFSTSIITWPFLIWLCNYISLKILILFNEILFIYLCIYLFVKRKSDIHGEVKKIFFRCIVIFAINIFFFIRPIGLKPFRKLLIELNAGNEYTLQNLLIFEYEDLYNEAYEKGYCDLAIFYAKKENECGQKWLGIIPMNEEENISKVRMSKDSISIADTSKLMQLLYRYPLDTSYQTDRTSDQTYIPDKKELRSIRGTYNNLYNGYRCKAEAEYAENLYQSALNYYLLADLSLNACDHSDVESWNLERAWSLSNIARCYSSLKQYQTADSLFNHALKIYKEISNSEDKKLAEFYDHLAEGYSKMSWVFSSNYYYNLANKVYKKDSLNPNSRKKLFLNYKSIAKNYLKKDSLEKAMLYIQYALKGTSENEIDHCNSMLLYGVCLYKLNDYQKADSTLTGCIKCFQSQQVDEQSLAPIYLIAANIKISLAKYEGAKVDINKGIDIVLKKYSERSSEYATYLRVLASLNATLGNYEDAEQEYNQVLDIYSMKPEENNDQLVFTLAGLANLEIKISKMNLAKQHADRSLSITKEKFGLDNHDVTDILNNVAYVNYFVSLYDEADSLYGMTIKIHSKDKRPTPSTAIALNGLGLVQLALKRYATADSLLALSLQCHLQIFRDNHPLTAVVYLNYGNLYIEEKKMPEAEKMLIKSLEINKIFFNLDHDIFGDIYIALGDLSKIKKENAGAFSWYTKALNIYLKKFKDNHWKVEEAKSKLQLINYQ